MLGISIVSPIWLHCEIIDETPKIQMLFSLAN